MNKSELIEITAKEADISKAAAEKALSAVMAAIVKTVSKGDSVTLVGFIQARRARWPQPANRQGTQDRRHYRATLHGRRHLQGRRCRQEGR